ncbi:MAG: glycoside hydrolase family 9 protein, partial [Candidatus Goldbacteria bacterium]|nr:glycoside hydrolase family 9 protein [Candidatus Goldiibacteriota bacterium]
INTSWNYNQSREIYIDNIEFYTQQEAINTGSSYFISYRPKINQLGYLPDANKFFIVVTQTASTNQIFYVKKVLDNSVVYTGYTDKAIIYDSAAREDVVMGDFSKLTAEGEYYIEINNQKSFNFKISKDIFDDLFKDVLRSYYIIRCGVALNDNKTGLTHSACHLQDASYDDKVGSRDFTGGWHNAGDFGKWTHEHAFSCSFMMWLYELRKQNMKGLKIDIPESNNKISDLLDEAKWGLSFLLKMQNTDGSIYHKVDTEPNFPWGLAPESDPYQRTAKPQNKGSTQFSTIDAATFCAVMCQAYRVFKDYDNAFAVKCSKAAVNAWEWLNTNPKVGQQDPYYTDLEYWEELMWAYAEMYRLTGNNYFANLFENELNIRQIIAPAWLAPQLLGAISIYYDARTPQTLKDKIKTKIINQADTYKNIVDLNGYKVAMLENEYYWGSNGNASGRGVLFLFAYLLTNNSIYREYALYQLHYLLGINSLEQSFITGYGNKKNLNPYHWTRMVYN